MKSNRQVTTALGAVLIAVFGAQIASAQSIYGNMSNFDVVNQTGQTAHGFEIQIDDSRINAGNISIWGRDRGVGMTEYGTVDAVTNGTITTITYSGGTTVFPASTTSGLSPTMTGDSCFGAQTGTRGCEHFGFAGNFTPDTANVRYSWLVGDPKQQLSPYQIVVPTVGVAAGGAVAAFDTTHGLDFGQPAVNYWIVASFQGRASAVDLGDLLRNGPSGTVLDKGNGKQFSQYEIWEPGNAAGTFANLAIPSGSSAGILRYDYFKYAGAFDEKGRIACHNLNDAGCQNALGDWSGSTLAGFNAQTSPAPEPGTYAMLLAGLGVMVLLSKRRLRRELA